MSKGRAKSRAEPPPSPGTPAAPDCRGAAAPCGTSARRSPPCRAHGPAPGRAGGGRRPARSGGQSGAMALGPGGGGHPTGTHHPAGPHGSAGGDGSGTGSSRALSSCRAADGRHLAARPVPFFCRAWGGKVSFAGLCRRWVSHLACPLRA